VAANRVDIFGTDVTASMAGVFPRVVHVSSTASDAASVALHVFGLCWRFINNHFVSGSV
jgi:hypothetical protein